MLYNNKNDPSLNLREFNILAIKDTIEIYFRGLMIEEMGVDAHAITYSTEADDDSYLRVFLMYKLLRHTVFSDETRDLWKPIVKDHKDKVQ